MASISEYDRIYQELPDRIIEVAKDLYGELAVKIASRIEGLEMSENGRVAKIFGPPENALGNLLCEYGSLGGKISKTLNEAVLKAYRKQYPDMNFPEN